MSFTSFFRCTCGDVGGPHCCGLVCRLLFLFSFLMHSSSVHTKPTDFCKLALCPATFLEAFLTLEVFCWALWNLSCIISGHVICPSFDFWSSLCPFSFSLLFTALENALLWMLHWNRSESGDHPVSFLLSVGLLLKGFLPLGWLWLYV